MHFHTLAVFLVISIIKALVATRKIKIPAYTCGSPRIDKARQNIAKFKALVSIAIAFVNFEPPLSIAIRLSNPEKMIAIPVPTNQSVSVFMCKGKAKLICTIPKRMIMQEVILIRLCTAGFIHLYRWTSYSAITTEYAAVSLFRLQGGFAICTLIEILASICRHGFFFFKAAAWALNCRLYC